MNSHKGPPHPVTRETKNLVYKPRSSTSMHGPDSMLSLSPRNPKLPTRTFTVLWRSSLFEPYKLWASFSTSLIRFPCQWKFEGFKGTTQTTTSFTSRKSNSQPIGNILMLNDK